MYAIRILILILAIGISSTHTEAGDFRSCASKVSALFKGLGSLFPNPKDFIPVDPSFSSAVVDIRLRTLNPSVDAEIARGHRIVHDGDFTQERDLPLYRNILGVEFEELLERLRVFGGHWIDMGAGRAFALTAFLKTSGDNVRGTAVVKADPDMRSTGRNLKILNRPGAEERFRHFTGEFIENYSLWRLTQLGQAELITDVYGPMTYSSRPDLVLETYFKLVPVGGKIFFTRFQMTEFETDFGMSRDMRRWLGEGRGYEIKFVGTHGVLIEKISDEYFIPSLTIMNFEAYTPPIRVFDVQSSRVRTSNRESLPDLASRRSLRPSEPIEVDSQDRR